MQFPKATPFFALAVTLSLAPSAAFAQFQTTQIQETSYVTTKLQLFREFWHTRLVSNFGNHGSPFTNLAGDRIFVGTNSGELICLDKSGQKIWKKKDLKSISAPGIVITLPDNQALLIIGTMDGTVYAFNPENGDQLWAQETQGGAILAKPYFELEDSKNPVIYVATEQARFFKLSAINGEKLWSFTHKPAIQEMTVRGHTPPVSTPNLENVYFGVSDGYIIALTKKSGLLTFKTPLAKKDTINRFTDVDVVPVFGGSAESPLIYVASYNGGLYAVDAKTGAIIWNQEQYLVSGIVNHGQGLAIVEPSGKIRGLDYNGFPQWETAFIPSQTGEPYFLQSEQVALVPTAKDGILVIDLREGRPLQSLDVGGEFSTELAFADDQLYFMTANGTLYSFSLIQ